MPIYEFVCPRCRHEFEELVASSERPACPRCASRDLEKRFSTFATNGDAHDAPSAESPGSCGTCGDPRGPGACAFD